MKFLKKLIQQILINSTFKPVKKILTYKILNNNELLVISNGKRFNYKIPENLKMYQLKCYLLQVIYKSRLKKYKSN